MKTVYLLLTRSSTIFSYMIRLLTGAAYTHVSISVENPQEISAGSGLYSFGRKHPLLWFPAGFVRENREGGYFRLFPRTACVLLALDVPDEAFHEISVRLRKMEICQHIYRYNLIGALLCGLGIRFERRRRYFCSQFVGDLLLRSHAAYLPKSAALMQPADYTDLPGVRQVYTGTVGELLGYPDIHRFPFTKMPGILAILSKLCYTEARPNK